MMGLGRLAHTLGHAKPWQVVGRPVAPFRRWKAVQSIPSTPEDLAPRWMPRSAFPVHDPWNKRSEILNGRFCFLSEAATLGRPVDWAAASMPLLWQFNLHYFHYLDLLEPREKVALCREWIRGNPVGKGVGWHPYPTALRIVNWCRAELKASDILESLYQQAAYLSRNLETHVYGNHLLENARALVLAGCYLQGQGEADAWLERGLDIYRGQTPEQILSDGFHFERSPMYHALMLEGYLDVLNVLPDGHPDSDWLERTAKEMADALEGMTHPDGQLALFNDSTFEIAPSPDQLFDYTSRVLQYEPQPRRQYPEAGYYVYEDEHAWLMMDAGPGGPSYLMAHAHADIFSFELSLFGERFVVDSGVYEYPAGPMRQYVRSTAAHNTVSVDGLDQIECWDSFRVARRSVPHDVQWEEAEGYVRFKGAYGGFSQLAGDGIEHRRHMDINSRARSITARDVVTGGGEHRVESYIHLHPEVDVTPVEGSVLLQRSGKECSIEFGQVHWRLEQGWYCPRFGERHRNCVLVLGEKAWLPIEVSYQIQY